MPSAQHDSKSESRSNAPPIILPPDHTTHYTTQHPSTNRSFTTSRAIMALILREMATRYGRSPGGYAWAILEPLGTIIILSIGFSLLVRSPQLGSSFLLFYASGFLPFNLYQTVSLVVSRSIDFSRPLLFYPAVTWVDAVMARFVLNAITGCLVTIIVMAGVLTFVNANVLLDIPPILGALALALLLGLGIGMLNCVLTGLLPIWGQIWSIITRPLFLISGIFFLYDTMSQMVRDILWYNPLIHIVAMMRTGFYPTYKPNYVDPVYVISVSLITLAFGMVLMRRYHRDILNNT